MLSKNFNLIFCLRRPKNYTFGEVPIFIRITIDGDPTEISTGRKCSPEHWDKKAEKAIGKKEEVKELNHHLATLKMKVFECRLKLLESNEEITVGLLKESLRGRQTKSRFILDIFQEHNQKMQALIDKEFSAATLERYKTSLDHTRSFIQWKYNKSDYDIDKLNFEFVSDYEFWLKSQRNCNHNTTIKYISNFRKIVNICLRNGWLTKDPFFGFKMTKREVERTALAIEDILAISEKRFASDRLSQVRDIFVFCCYTGLAYADVKKLKRTEIGLGVNGELWIMTNRQKTGTSSRIPILPSAKDIIDKYATHPQCMIENRLLPVLSNQKMNAYLKEISDICGINKNLTFHIARHTFATTVTLCNGVPIESVSKMLGHKNLKTTQHYAKVLDIKVGDDMKLLKQKFLKS